MNMKRKVLSVLKICLAVIAVWIVFLPNSDPSVSPEAPTRGVGNAAALTGRCLWIHILIDDPESAFGDGDIQNVAENVAAAAEFLAAKAPVPLELTGNQPDLWLRCDSSLAVSDELEKAGWIYHLIDQQQQEIDQLRRKYRPDSVALLLHINKTGRSFTISQRVGGDERYNTEFSLLFTAAADAAGTVLPATAFVYIHETLHQFGAVDLYFPFDQDDARRELAARLFPGDIMLAYTRKPEQASLSDVDAYLIGWQEHIRRSKTSFLNAIEDG